MGESSSISKEFENLVLNQIVGINQILVGDEKKEADRECQQGEMILCAVRKSASSPGEAIDETRVKVALARVNALKSEALHKKNIAVYQENEYGELKSELLDVEGKFDEYAERYGGLKDEIGEKLAGLSEKFNQYQKMEEEQRNQIEDLERRIRKANEKANKAKSWYMIIPGYNIYLLADACTDGDVGRLKQLKETCDNIKLHREKIERELQEFQQQIRENNTELGKCTKELMEVKESILKVCSEISECGKEIKKWNDLYMLYADMERDIRLSLIHI